MKYVLLVVFATFLSFRGNTQSKNVLKLTSSYTGKTQYIKKNRTIYFKLNPNTNKDVIWLMDQSKLDRLIKGKVLKFLDGEDPSILVKVENKKRIISIKSIARISKKDRADYIQARYFAGLSIFTGILSLAAFREASGKVVGIGFIGGGLVSLLFKHVVFDLNEDGTAKIVAR